MAKMQLFVVSVLTVLYAIPSYDITHWTAVDGKQDGSQYGSLRDADVETDCW